MPGQAILFARAGSLPYMDTWNDRLRAACVKAGRKQTELARACGVSSPAVSDWLAGKTKNMRPENLFKAADYLGVSPRWIATGKESRHRLPAIDVQLWMDCWRGVQDYVSLAGVSLSDDDVAVVAAQIYSALVDSRERELDPALLETAVHLAARLRSDDGQLKAQPK